MEARCPACALRGMVLAHAWALCTPIVSSSTWCTNLVRMVFGSLLSMHGQCGYCRPSFILQHTATLWGHSGQWHPLAQCHAEGLYGVYL